MKGRGGEGMRKKENGLKLRNYWNFYSVLFGRKDSYRVRDERQIRMGPQRNDYIPCSI